MSETDEPGLYLVGSVRRSRSPQIVTQSVSGISDGRLYRLKLIARKYSEKERIESTDEAAQGEGVTIRYPTEDLQDGFYEAHSTCDERTVFIEVAAGRVKRTLRDARQTLSEMKRA